jgi:NTP pyrophosphatase (non-canonical NTP hydrolase)
MNVQEYLLTKLAEECVEVAQRASKANIFGPYETQPGHCLNNVDRIADELEDVRVILDLLQERCGFYIRTHDTNFAERKAKVLEYMEYSRQCGRLT